ncbi:MAG: GAF domain-containing sensor histidine kinase [Candidatus Thermoplasmatota archaeon]|nr:GAF domain-containing sensor histidine kinase [Candidatus Thermoplasmatota archaeon]
MTRYHSDDEQPAKDREADPIPSTIEPRDDVVALNRELRLRTEIARVVSSYTRPSELLTNILSILCKGFGALGGSVYFLDKGTNEIELKAIYGLDRNYAATYQKIHLGQNVTGQVAQTGEGMIIRDATKDRRSTKGVVQMLRYRSAVVTPVTSGGEVIGIIALVSETASYFTQKDLKLLDEIGAHISPAIVNSFLNQRIMVEKEKLLDILDRLDEGIFEAEVRNSLPMDMEPDLAVSGLFENGTFTLMNRSFSDQCDEGIWLGADIRTGFEEKQLLRMLLEVVHKGEVKAIERRWTGEKERIFEVSMLRVDKDSRIKGIKGTRRDVTQRSLMDEKVRESKRQTEFYMDLMSHDISNINTAVLGFLDMMESGTRKAHDIQRFINIGREEIKRSSQIVQKVKVLARVQREAPNLVIMDVSKSILKNFDLVKRQYPKRTLVLEHEPGLSSVNVLCDGLIDELIQNIFRFGIEGSTDEKVSFDAQVRKWEYDGRKGYLFSFQNGSCRISKETRERVMNRGLCISGEPPGSGLALSVVKAITDRYNGRIWFEDQTVDRGGSGTTTMIFLPSRP